MNLKNISTLLIIMVFPTLVSAQKYLSTEMPEITTTWKGETFTSTKSFVDNIKEAPQFTVLSKILEDKSLVQDFNDQEMITVFAITDDAFSKLDKKQRDSILGDKPLISSMVRYLVVPGRIDKHGMEKESKNHNGTAYLKTLNGQDLGVTSVDGHLYVVDPEGRKAAIVASDFYHKNGFFHIIDGLVFPSSKE